MQKLDALQAKVEQLEQKQQAGQRQIDAVDADRTVDAILRDADQRSQLLQAQGFTAGYSKGKFLIQSEDGNFVLNPNVQFQFRGVLNDRENTKNGGDSDAIDSGFEARRLKFAVDGNIFTKDLVYKFQWATSRSTGNLQLDEGWVRYHIPNTPFALRGGTITSDWDHETGVSSKRQLAVERSVLHEIISGGGTGSENYLQAVQGIYDPGKGPLRASLAITDGFATRNTNFQDSGGGSTLLGINNPQWGAFARVDYKFSGDWKQYDDFTALGNTDDLLVVGGGAEYDAATNINAIFHTVDVQWEPQSVKGLSVYGAYVGLYRDFRNGTPGSKALAYDWGLVAQAGYLLNKNWEVFGRYDYTSLDDDAPTGTGTLGAAALVEDHIHEFTVGLNYYLQGHAAKFTIDASWLPNGSPVSLDGAGVLAQPSDDNQFVLRAQFQLLL